jgi:hypothetical protein
MVVGPTVRDQAIVYDELTTVEDLRIGWTDREQIRRKKPPDIMQRR